jgi:N-acetylglucosamine-6-phosphate deacetylase
MKTEAGRAYRLTGKLVSDGLPVTVTVEGHLIADVVREADAAALGGSDVWIAPGFHDLQVNGYGGRDFNAGSWGLDAADGSTAGQDFAGLQRDLARHGTALFCPTIVTDAAERMAANLRRIAEAVAGDPCLRHAVTGVHLEGPFLSPEDGPRGAHPVEHVRLPDWDLFQAFQDDADGLIRICTLAPELPGALAFIERLLESGVVAAIGHTGASATTIRDAVSAGATLSTHLGNGCHDRIPRHDSYIWEQLACDDLVATLIVDGHHIEPAEARVMVRAKNASSQPSALSPQPQASGRVALISDSVKLGGMPPGFYAERRFEVKEDGSIVLAGTPYLAGASALLDVCMVNALQWTDMDLGQVVACVTEVPARVLRLPAKGRIERGYDADMTLFRLADHGPLEVVATVTAGEIVYAHDREGGSDV